MIGVIVNTATVLLGSAIGLLFKKAIPKKLADAVMIALGLCTLYIGVSGALEGNNTIVVIIAMVLGTIVGTLLNIDGHLNGLGDKLGERISKNGAGEKGAVAQGFVTGSLLFCVGAMTIVGGLKAGLEGDNELYLTKSILDLISSAMLSVSLGVGVMFSSVFVLVFQGAIVLLSGLLAPILSDAAIAEITCAGSLMIIAIGLNLVGIPKIKVANLLPALVFAPLVLYAYDAIAALL